MGIRLIKGIATCIPKCAKGIYEFFLIREEYKQCVRKEIEDGNPSYTLIQIRRRLTEIYGDPKKPSLLKFVAFPFFDSFGVRKGRDPVFEYGGGGRVYW